MATGKHDRRRRSKSPRRTSSRERRKSSKDRKRASSDDRKRSSSDRKRSPSSRERDDRKRSSDRKPSPRDDRSRRRSPKQERSSRKPPSFNPFSRGRKPTRDTHKRSSFQRSRSRTTSRSTSRGTSSDRIRLPSASFLVTPYWDTHKSTSLPKEKPIGFAIPHRTPVASSRLDGQFYLALSSLIGLSSLAAAVPPHLREGREVATLALQGVSFSFALLTGIGLRYDSTRRVLTRPLFRAGTPLSHVSYETVLNTWQFLFCCIIMSLSFSTPQLANDTPSSIWNTNVYYSTLAGMGFSSYLVADGYTSEICQVYWSQGHSFKSAALRRSWALVLIAQVSLVAFCLQGMTMCDGGCSDFTLGIVLAVIGGLLAAGHFIFRIVKTTRGTRPQSGVKRVSLIEIVFSSVNFILASVNAALLSNNKDEHSSINVYFTCWISFFLSLNLCLRYFDAHLSPGSMMDEAEFNSLIKMNIAREEAKKASTDLPLRRQSTGSTKSSKSNAFVDRVQDAAQAEAHLESMVASHESSDPILYLDYKTEASALSMDEEFGNGQQLPVLPPPMRMQQSKIRRADPSICVPNTGIDPQPSVSTASQQKSVRALMPPPAMSMPAPVSRSRRPSIDPQEFSSTPLAQQRRAPPPPTRKRDPSMTGFQTKTAEPEEPRITPFPQAKSSDPEESSSSPSEYQRGPIKRRASVARSAMAESVSTASHLASTKEMSRREQMQQQSRYTSVQSMTSFATKSQRPSVSVPTKLSPTRETGRTTTKMPKNRSMISLFEEDFSKDVMAAMAQVEIDSQLPSVESSPNTLDLPPTLDPSLSSKMQAQSPAIRASPSIKSIRTNKSKQSVSMSKGSKSLSRAQSHPSRDRSGSSPVKSPTSSRARSSTTHGSRGPPTLSEDGSRSNQSSHPLTVSDNEEDVVYNADIHEQSPSVQDRPVRDISMDNLSIVSDPTMDGFDQSLRFDQSTRDMLLGDTAETLQGDEQDSQTGTVDQMVMMALKQAYESRQQSLRQASGEERSRDTRSSVMPRRATSEEAPTNTLPKRTLRHSASERIVKKTSGSGFTGSSGKSIRSFYSNNADSHDGSNEFAC